MADTSKIEWCDSTFNPWIGCTKIGPGCDHCYAERHMDKRLGKARWGAGNPRVRTGDANWRQPLRWNARPFVQCTGCGWRGEWATNGSLACCPDCVRPESAMQAARRRVFCASLADVFDNEVPERWRRDLFRVIAETPHLDWLLLTKRIGNAGQMLADATGSRTPWNNVWIGATVVNQAEADRDVPKLLRVPARVRFLSIEPMLGPVDLNQTHGGTRWIGGQRGCGGTHRHSGDPTGHDHGGSTKRVIGDPRQPHHHHDDRCGSGIDWVIAGGESGPARTVRILHHQWARNLRDQCAAAGVPFLFKQWGEYCHPTQMPDDCEGSGSFVDDFFRVGKKAAGRELDGVEHNGFPAVRHG